MDRNGRRLQRGTTPYLRADTGHTYACKITKTPLRLLEVDHPRIGLERLDRRKAHRPSELRIKLQVSSKNPKKKKNSDEI